MKNKVEHLRELCPWEKVNTALTLSVMHLYIRSQSKMHFLLWVLRKKYLKTTISAQSFPNPRGGCRRYQSLGDIHKIRIPQT